MITPMKKPNSSEIKQKAEINHGLSAVTVASIDSKINVNTATTILTHTDSGKNTPNPMINASIRRNVKPYKVAYFLILKSANGRIQTGRSNDSINICGCILQ